MIRVRRINNKEFVVNSELILFIEETPDTVITLTTGQKIVVADSVDDVINKVIDYRAKFMQWAEVTRERGVRFGYRNDFRVNFRFILYYIWYTTIW